MKRAAFVLALLVGSCSWDNPAAHRYDAAQAQMDAAQRAGLEVAADLRAKRAATAAAWEKGAPERQKQWDEAVAYAKAHPQPSKLTPAEQLMSQIQYEQFKAARDAREAAAPEYVPHTYDDPSQHVDPWRHAHEHDRGMWPDACDEYRRIGRHVDCQ